MKDFFDEANMVVEAMASAVPITAQGVFVETPIPSTKPVPVDEDTHTKRVSEPTSIPAETLTPQKGVASLISSHPEIESPATPLVISMNDPFTALSQAVKDGLSLVVTLDADLSSKDSKEVLEHSDDEPTMTKRVSNSDKEEEGGDHETETMGTCLLYLLSFSLHPFSLPFSSFFLL